MILIFGGTTEGRKVVVVCESAAKHFYYSTKTKSQKIETAHGTHITGGLDEKGIIDFCKEKGIKLIVDAAHPFAEVLHQNIAQASRELNIPVVRYERNYPKQEKDLLWFGSYSEAIESVSYTHLTLPTKA